MRQLWIEVPRGRGDEAMAHARDADGVNVACAPVDTLAGPRDLVLAHVPNDAVERLVASLGGIEGLRITLAPHGVLALHPPAEDAPDQVVSVEPRSPIEVFLSGLQSVGSWAGMLGYAVAAGAIVWIGLLTKTIYLLVAAMLVAPYAGPAMNAALATARGDARLLRRAVTRYAASLAVSIAAAALLTLAFRQQSPTSVMVDVSNLSIVAFLLPLTAGAAGALNLVQSERDSLVSGAAVGVLIAASLAPPAGVVGIALVLGEWSMMLSGAFVLALQLVGINISGALVFRAYGLDHEGPRYDRGRGWVTAAALAASALVVAGLVGLQATGTPELEQSSVAHRAETEAGAAVAASGVAELVQVEARFPRGADEDALLVTVWVQPAEGADAPPDEIAQRVARQVTDRLERQDYGATPLVDVRVVG